MLRSYDLVVLAEPTPWHRAGQNRKTGVTFKKKVDVDAQFHIRKAWMEKFGELGVIPKPFGIRLAVTALIKAPAGMSKKRRKAWPLPVGRPDTDNLMKNVKDALSRYAYADDSQIVTLLARKRYALDPEGADTPPRWVITLEVIDDGSGTEEHFAGYFGYDGPDFGSTGTSIFGPQRQPGADARDPGAA